MRVVPNTVEVSKDARRALRHYYGQSGLASREDFRQWIDGLVSDNIDGLLYDLDTAVGRRPVPAALVGGEGDGE